MADMPATCCPKCGVAESPRPDDGRDVVYECGTQGNRQSDKCRIAELQRRLDELRNAAAKYRCLCRSEGPVAMTFQAGKELDDILEEAGETK